MVLADVVEEEFFFIGSGSAGGNEAEGVATRSVNNCPVLVGDSADGEMPHFAGLNRWQRNNGPVPERGCGLQTKAVLGRVGVALGWIPIELHVDIVRLFSRTARANREKQKIVGRTGAAVPVWLG